MPLGKKYSLWFNREIPTLYKTLMAVSDDGSLPTFKTTFQELLEDLSFVDVKNQDSALLESNNIVNWRRNYLERIRHY